MLQSTPVRLIVNHYNRKYRQHWTQFRYKKLTRWMMDASGVNKWNHLQSHRRGPMLARFNPESVTVTKGTSKEAWKWYWYQQRWLPRQAPDGYEKPVPLGRIAWPVGWDDDVASRWTALTDAELFETLMAQMTQVIFEETQRDGYELRRLDFEGNPLTPLPERSIIEAFVLQEDTMRERVVKRVVEDTFRLTPTSDQFASMNSVQNVIAFVIDRVRQCREPWKPRHIPPTVMTFLAQQPLQPRFGFEFALPKDDRPALLQDWERLFHHDWQFGKAVFAPRKTENTRGNLVWLRCEAEQRERDAFEVALKSGELKRRHEELIAEAAARQPENAT